MKSSKLAYIIGRGVTYALITATAVLVFLKIQGFISVSWWVVFLPLLSPVALLVVVIAAFFIIYNILFKKWNG